MASSPKAGALPVVDLVLSIGGIDLPNHGYACKQLQYKAMVNGGYIVRAKLVDPHSKLLDLMMANKYFEQARAAPVTMTFKIKWHKDGTYPESATKEQTAYMLSVKAKGGTADINFLEFIGVDPPSWHLNAGDASGSVYKGKISKVIRKVVEDYAPGISVDVSDTKDSDENYWPMMRLDPKSFLMNFVDFSSSFTRKKTNWIVTPTKDRLIFKEQAEIGSTQRAYYRHTSPQAGHDTLDNWSFLADNALSLSNSKIVTSGLSAVSGQYLDRKTDWNQEKYVYTTDANTSNKKTAQTSSKESYSKPPDTNPPGSGTTGWTHIPGVPELYSAGDVGLPYQDYIDGRGRNLYLSMANMLFRAKFTVVGHGEWSGCEGLGTDTIYVRWHDGANMQSTKYFLNGNWLVYGYEHFVDERFWWTDVYCARFDYDAASTKVGG